MRRGTAVAGMALGALLLLAPPAQAAATSPVATWTMGEPAGSRTMVDSYGSHDGAIGSDVVLTGSAYTFPFVDARTYRPQHLVTVPDSSALDPGTGSWAVTARFKTGNYNSNVLQKGQSSSPGGFLKMEIHQGLLSCLFRGDTGSRAVSSGRTLSDGIWHTVRCERSGTTVSMTIDGAAPRQISGATGNISNAAPFVIGGKASCNATTVGCDYWSGQMDDVRIQHGP